MDIFERYSYEHQFQVGWCPICNQGRQIIMKTSDGTLAICCEECMSAWPTPEDINDPDKATFDELELDAIPTYEEIVECGWDKFFDVEGKGDRNV